MARRYKELTEVCHQRHYPGDFGEIEPTAILVNDIDNKKKVVNRAFPISAWIEGDEPIAHPIDRHNPLSLKLNIKEVIKPDPFENLSDTSKTSKKSISKLSRMKTMMRKKTKVYDRKYSEDSQMVPGRESFDGSQPVSGDNTNVNNSMKMS